MTTREEFRRLRRAVRVFWLTVLREICGARPPRR